jgi:endonuclease/exonuclease/phosphatase (EEP) superfamily protein YafD
VSALSGLAWIVTAILGLVALSQVFGFTWIPLLWVLQALTPLGLIGAVGLAVIALLRHRRWMATANGTIAVSLLWVVAPLVAHGETGAASDGAVRLTVASANVYYLTDRADDVAAELLSLDVDVIAMTEFSADVDAAFAAAGGDVRYPYEASTTPGDRNGIALLSRHRIVDSVVAPLGHSVSVDATLDVAGTLVRIVVVHPLPGTDGEALDAWSADIPLIGEVADPTDPSEVPVMIVGDFNATRWHPAFRRLLDDGWRSAHEALGRGWTRSWPIGGLTPPLVRIDHALLSRAVAAESVADFAIPGSDHAGFVVTVAVEPD